MTGPFLDAIRGLLAVFGAGCVLGAVAIGFDVLGSASRLVHTGEGLACHWWVCCSRSQTGYQAAAWSVYSWSTLPMVYRPSSQESPIRTDVVQTKGSPLTA